MALSGTVMGSFTGTSTANVRPAIEWSATQSVTGNSSTITATLVFLRYNTSWGSWQSSHTSKINIDGNSSSNTTNFNISGKSREVIWTRTRTVSHASNGTKSVTLGASGSTSTSLGSYNFSSSVTLDTIPRSSEVTAFSMASALQVTTANSVSVRLNVYSTAFRFDVVLRYGSTNIATWSNQSFTHNTSKSLALSTTQVNNLLSAMKNVTSGTVTIRVQTKSSSGGSNIGSVQTRNATASVNDNVKPTATGLSVSVSGGGRDNLRNKFIQSISRVTASFTGNAIGGATVSSRSIVIRENASKGNSMTINSASGTTGTLTRSGTYEAIASVKDSRGRTTTQRITFTVHAYSPPSITTFAVDRNSATPTTVNISRAGRFTPLGTGDNTLSILVQRRVPNGAWVNVESTSTAISTFSGTVNSTGNSVTSSYEFRFYISDSFGNNAETTATITTQQVVLDVHKNEGVGIGKIHENGSLDVGGDVYFDGDIRTFGQIRTSLDTQIWNSKSISSINATAGSPDAWNLPNNSNLKLNNSNNAMSFIVGGTQNQRQGIIQVGHNGEGFAQHLGTLQLNPFGGNVMIGDAHVISSGSNSSGEWVRFYDGTQICYRTVAINLNSNGWQYYNHAMGFLSVPSVSGIPTLATDNAHRHAIQETMIFSSSSSQIRALVMADRTATTITHDFVITAIGRWK